ncbi:hypothetical protein CALVIDRAFT_536744 [Calocera viscosa TUFC12733]|uniref:Cytochrome b561 domain-containing protein n=1 Tax=Calocera viscosa (strain TUFC12733) TaxID=1330018 RepID=A0A167MKV7_CALVF|nr:hypothetical protein CALVIDRAFT_536744 [Calocera viscosa TUFC12733]
MADVQLRQTYPTPQTPTIMEQPEHEPLLDDGERTPAPELPTAEPAKRVVKEDRAGDSTFYLVAYAGLMLFVLSAWYLVFSTGISKLGWFAYHPTSQSLGIAIMVVAIETLQPTATSTSKKLGLVRHQNLQIAALVLLSVGTSAMVINKAVHAAPHITTWHALFGLVAYLWLWAQSVFGAASVWWKGAAFGGEAKGKKMWKWHRISGYALLLWMLATVFLAGEYSDWTRGVSGPVFRAFGFGVSLVLVAVGVLGRTRVGKMRFW